MSPMTPLTRSNDVIKVTISQHDTDITGRSQHLPRLNRLRVCSGLYNISMWPYRVAQMTSSQQELKRPITHNTKQHAIFFQELSAPSRGRFQVRGCWPWSSVHIYRAISPWGVHGCYEINSLKIQVTFEYFILFYILQLFHSLLSTSFCFLYYLS